MAAQSAENPRAPPKSGSYVVCITRVMFVSRLTCGPGAGIRESAVEQGAPEHRGRVQAPPPVVAAAPPPGPSEPCSRVPGPSAAPPVHGHRRVAGPPPVALGRRRVRQPEHAEHVLHRGARRSFKSLRARSSLSVGSTTGRNACRVYLYARGTTSVRTKKPPRARISCCDMRR